jgi:NADPH:quinone reductase-like Zn-dependent oxidoreductase
MHIVRKYKIANLLSRLELSDRPLPTPGPSQLLVKINACALNHRDLFIRQHLYPAISFSAPMFADGCGTVTHSSSSSFPVGARVLMNPSHGWTSDPAGPEDAKGFAILGGSKTSDLGMGQEFIAVDEDEVVLCPEHLSSVEGAALPLVGLTAWRALVTKSGAAEKGRNILITGIGGGVALHTLQFAVAFGCNVFVTSGDEEKLAKAKEMGAHGGVSYKSADWDKQLLAQLPKDRPFLDAVIDGAGGDVVARSLKLLKVGGVIVQYGMTINPKMDWLMSAVLKNIDLRGSTMGSRKEFRDMVEFVKEKKIKPVVSRVVKGLDNLDGIDGLFEDMKAGRQFGKLVLEVAGEEEGGESPSKL